MTPRRIVVGFIVAAGLLACAAMVWIGNGERSKVARPMSAADRKPFFQPVEFANEGETPRLPRGNYFFPEIMCGGAGMADLDHDGRLELLTFSPVAESPGHWSLEVYSTSDDSRIVQRTTIAHWVPPHLPMGLAIGDVNNDGLPDIHVTAYGPDRLYLNGGDGTFVDVSASAGIDNNSWGTSCSFVDYDRDGWLDLIVVNYVDYHPSQRCVEPNGRPDYCNPKLLHPIPARLYHNETGRASNVETAELSRGSAPPVQFRDVSLNSQIGLKVGPGLGVVCADMNGDRWPDFLVANDGAANFLWINQHDGTFREEAVARGVAYDSLGRPQANMGIALGDIDSDGGFDLLITHLGGEGSALYVSRSPGIFDEAAGAAGLGRPSFRWTGFGAAFLDIDHDGALDLAVVNGRVKRRDGAPYPAMRPDGKPASLADYWSAYAERSQLYMNDGSGRFREMPASDEPLTREAAVSRGLAAGDFDNDGDLDVIVAHAAGPARLFRNDAPKKGHWITVRAIEPALGGRDALGAIVTLVAGQQRRLRLVNAGGSYLASSDPRVHFGLGELAAVDSFEVVWPDGSDEAFDGGPVDRFVTLEHGRGRAP